jgi:hypothetical protein
VTDKDPIVKPRYETGFADGRISGENDFKRPVGWTCRLPIVQRSETADVAVQFDDGLEMIEDLGRAG